MKSLFFGFVSEPCYPSVPSTIAGVSESMHVNPCGGFLKLWIPKTKGS